MFDVHLYFSGDVSQDVEQYLLAGDVYRLHSFAYPKYAFKYLALAESMGKRARMIIDSGAFTSWSVGKPVQLKNLLDYNDELIRRYGDKHDLHFIALDVIPGERGRRATSSEIEAAVLQSYDNFVTMQQHLRGRYVLPVFHSGEEYELLNRYLALTDYVCLSMDQGMGEKHRREWAQRTVVPGFKFHGLAATGNNMVTAIPWYSVDSSSWLTVSNMGNILWPTDDGRFRTLAVSKESPQLHDAGQHLDNLTPHERASVVKYIESHGFDVAPLAEHYEYRRKWNAYQWMNPPWRTKVTPVVDLFAQC